MAAHLSFKVDYHQYLLEKRSKAHTKLMEFVEDSFYKPEQFTGDKVEVLLKKFAMAISKYTRAVGATLAALNDRDKVDKIIEDVEKHPWLNVEQIMTKIIELNPPDCTLRMYLEHDLTKAQNMCGERLKRALNGSSNGKKKKNRKRKNND